MSMSALRIAQCKAEQIEYQNNRRKPTHMRSKHKGTNQELFPCQCMICGEYLDLLTHAHANKHNYTDKKAIIKAGYIRFLGG